MNTPTTATIRANTSTPSSLPVIGRKRKPLPKHGHDTDREDNATDGESRIRAQQRRPDDHCSKKDAPRDDGAHPAGWFKQYQPFQSGCDLLAETCRR